MNEELRGVTWLTIMNMLLGEVSDDVYKNEGEIIYDTLSPAATGIMILVAMIEEAYANAFIFSCSGNYLDEKCKERGLTRIAATSSVRRITVADTQGNPMDLPIGVGIATKASDVVVYTVTEKESDGVFKCVCNEEGTIGNKYMGECECLSPITSIGQIVMTDIIESGRDTETDAALRQRYLESVNEKPFAGNVIAYKNFAGTVLPTVSQIQVYPRTAEDENIILSVVDNDNLPMTPEQLSEIKEILDPTEFESEGYGLVPINHKIQMATPVETTINIECEITVNAGYTVEGVSAEIRQKITEYLEDTRNSWAILNPSKEYVVTIYMSQIVACAMSVEGVLSVDSVIINNAARDLALEETRTRQEMPKVGTITIS